MIVASLASLAHTLNGLMAMGSFTVSDPGERDKLGMRSIFEVSKQGKRLAFSLSVGGDDLDTLLQVQSCAHFVPLIGCLSRSF